MKATRQRAISARHHCSGLSLSSVAPDSPEAAERSLDVLGFNAGAAPEGSSAAPPETPSRASPWGILRCTSALVQEAVSVGRPEHTRGRPARANNGGDERVHSRRCPGGRPPPPRARPP